MRVWIVVNVLMLALGLATTFRVNEVIETIEEFVDESPEARQDDINDNIPAVFAATLGASLLANVLFGGSANTNTGPTLNRIDCKCGVEGTNRIIGGSSVMIPNKYPWMARVLRADGVSCGGSIVASKFVLTAAHCLFKDAQQTMPQDASDVTVRIGDHDIDTEDETTNLDQRTIRVANIIIHEDYEPNFKPGGMGESDPPGLVNDIALLELEEELDLMDYTPVCLARAGINEAGMPSAFVYGWGADAPGPAGDCGSPTSRPSILKETELEICTQAESEAFPGIPGGLVEGQLCAKGDGTTPFRGDSGGPLSIKSGNQHVQVGDVSFGDCPPATGDIFGVYGRISVLREWLEGKMPGATTCSNGFDADTQLTRNWSNSGPSRWRLQQQAEAERRRQEEIDNKRRKEEKIRRKAEKKKRKQEKKQKRKEEAAAAAAAAEAAAEATTESAAEETTMQ